jgi:hypothetical protein
MLMNRGCGIDQEGAIAPMPKITAENAFLAGKGLEFR